MVPVSAISVAARTAGSSNLSVFLEQGEVLVRRVPVPALQPRFALLELILAGICNTDLELKRGYYNFQGIPGHEFVARVVECDTPDLLGRRVAGEINLACGDCDFCLRGLARHCRNRSVLGILGHPGAFSEFFTLPEANLHVVPDSVLDEEAVFTEPLAAACEILDQIPLQPGSLVAVLGDGKLGLLITQVLLAHQLKVTLFGHHESKLTLASCAGAQVVLSGADTPQSAFPVVVESTGSTKGLETAIQMVEPRGTVVMKSTIHSTISIDMAPVIVNEISLIGSRCGRFEAALQLLENRKVQVLPMISARFPLGKAPEAFDWAAAKGTIKVLLCPEVSR